MVVDFSDAMPVPFRNVDMVVGGDNDTGGKVELTGCGWLVVAIVACSASATDGDNLSVLEHLSDAVIPRVGNEEFAIGEKD